MRKLLIIVALLLFPAWVQAATVTHAVATASTTDATSYVSGAFTPAAGDLLVAFVVANATVAAGTMTDSQALGFTKNTSAIYDDGGGVTATIYLFVSNATAAASSMTVTFDCTGDAATGTVIEVARVSSLTRTGSSAVLRSAVTSSGSNGNVPAATFAAAALTGNPTLGVVGNLTNPATLTPPTSWTEQSDTGFATPTTGTEYVSRDSGFTGTVITWGSSSASNYGVVIVEMDTSAAGGAAGGSKRQKLEKIDP